MFIATFSTDPFIKNIVDNMSEGMDSLTKLMMQSFLETRTKKPMNFYPYCSNFSTNDAKTLEELRISFRDLNENEKASFSLLKEAPVASSKNQQTTKTKSTPTDIWRQANELRHNRLILSSRL